ncbi:MAG: hypothetical protein JSS83_10895 [Cyanobacteria bacterium SZAS LIN-3]|nr:hypothetical protein [Cyanobacteria bacterium SZAS LIN-3]MBS2006032.1 hypothetical protein [Cyanobacteria bacterium SZAS TMP-1]
MTALGQFQEGITLYNSANEARDTHRYEEALQGYERALAHLASAAEPLRICLHYDLALCYDFAGEVEKAGREFVRVISMYTALSQQSPADPAVKNLKEIIDGCIYQLELRAEKHPLAEHYLSSVTPRRFKAADMPLKLYIDESEYSGYDQEQTEVIIRAFDLWIKGAGQPCRELHLDKPLCYQIWDDPADANIRVHRAGGNDDTASGATPDINKFTAGTASATAARLNKLLPATSGGQTTYIHNNRLRQATIWAYLPKYSSAQLSAREKRVFQSLIVHEAGHALGIDGHSPFGTDLMYWKSQLSEPTMRDLKTLALIYL